MELNVVDSNASRRERDRRLYFCLLLLLDIVQSAHSTVRSLEIIPRSIPFTRRQMLPGWEFGIPELGTLTKKPRVGTVAGLRSRWWVTCTWVLRVYASKRGTVLDRRMARASERGLVTCSSINRSAERLVTRDSSVLPTWTSRSSCDDDFQLPLWNCQWVRFRGRLISDLSPPE